MMPFYRRLALTSALSLGLVSSAIASTTSAQGVRRFALLVGTNAGGGDRQELRFAVNDAQMMADVFGEVGGVAEEDILLLEHPNAYGFARALEELHRRVENASDPALRTEVILYYSGHSDEFGMLFGEQRFTYHDLKFALDQLPADVRIAILDSCSSGALVRTKGGKHHAPFLVDVSSDVRGRAILTSSSADEAAQESDRLKGSFFTHYLVAGLRGAADTNEDLKITLNEAYRYAYAETLSRTQQTLGGAQHAAYDIQLAGTGDLIMTDLRRSSATVTLANNVQGHLFIIDNDGNVAAEVEKQEGGPVTLGLTAGEYTVNLEDGSDSFSTRLNVADSSSDWLDMADFGSVEREVTQLRGSTPSATQHPQGLIAVPVRRSQKKDLPSPKEGNFGPVAFSLFPGASTTRPGKATSMLGVHMVSNKHHSLLGVDVGLGFSNVKNNMYGVQASVAANRAGSAHGLQAAVGANISEQDSRAIQAAVGFNYAGDFALAQLSVGANTANKDSIIQVATGLNYTAKSAVLQTSVGMNFASKVRGAQITAGVNWTAESINGLQVSSALNYAKSTSGAQIGIVNIAGNVSGAQIGIINVAKNVTGVQVGVVNVSNTMKGMPIGLLSIVKEGQFHPSVFAQSIAPVNVDVKWGSKLFYTFVTLGVNPDSGYFGPGLGVGLHFPAGHFFVDVDGQVVSELNFNNGIFSDASNGVGFSARAIAGWQIAEHFAPFVGTTLMGRPNGEEILGQGRAEGAKSYGSSARFGLIGGLRF